MNEYTGESPKKLRKKKWKQGEALMQVHMVHPDPKKITNFYFSCSCRKVSSISSCPQSKRRTKEKRTIAKALIKVIKKYEV